MLAVVWLITPSTYAHEGSHGCGGPEIVIEGGNPSPYTLPIQGDETFEVEPDSVLTIRGVNLPVDARLHWGVQGLGTELAGKDIQISNGVTTNTAAKFSDHARGVYAIKGSLFSGPVELCSIPFELTVSGFGGTSVGGNRGCFCSRG